MLPVLLVLTAFTAIATIIGSALGGGRWCGYYFPKYWAKLFCWFTIVRVKVSGRENISKDTSYVFVANHQGAYDIFSVYGFLNHQFRWMMKKSLQKIPLVGYSCLKSGQIYVDNSSRSALQKTMATAEKQLRGGMSLVVFPEGSRTLTGRMGAFKRGAYKLATEFQLPMVPLTIDGAYKVLPRTAILPHWGTIHLTIHKPIPPAKDEAGIPAVMEATKRAIASSLPSER
ncbi:MAG: 1-acyl-sn-glycerol-3-phosphate acyltransferase [Bacteroidales bacterium]|nr:1-acyl-sn-glycerol-3-phosphate acyltransferase [Bacteroidales bacterium]